MKAKLLIDNKEFAVEISDEELEKLKNKAVKKTGYERVVYNERYYSYRGLCVTSFIEGQNSKDDNLYDSGEYYSDITVAENNLRADMLMRRLRRFAVEHREESLSWENETQTKYFICYDYDSKYLDIDIRRLQCDFGVIYFDSRATAQLAIETFYNELIWYFTEYKDSL